MRVEDIIEPKAEARIRKVRRFDFGALGAEPEPDPEPQPPAAAPSPEAAPAPASAGGGTSEAPPPETESEGFHPASEVMVETFTRQQLDEARQEGMEAGYQQAKEDMEHQMLAHQREEEARLNHMLAQFVDGMNALEAGLEGMREEASSEAARLACAIAKKVSGDALQHNPLPVIEETAGKCMGMLFTELSVRVRVHPSLVPELETRIHQIGVQNGYSGRIKVQGDETLELGDVRMQWKHGAAERSGKALWQEIDRVVARITGGAPQDDAPEGESAETEAPAAITEDEVPAPAADQEASPLADDVPTYPPEPDDDPDRTVF